MYRQPIHGSIVASKNVLGFGMVGLHSEAQIAPARRTFHQFKVDALHFRW